MTSFIEILEDGMHSNVITYSHPSRPEKVKLVPVIHIGEPAYYSALLEMIGEDPCLYEIVLTGDKTATEMFNTFVHEEDYDELIRIIKEDSFFKKNRAIFKQFMKKYAPLEIKLLHGQLKALFWVFRSSTLDEIFRIANLSQFDLGSIILLQRFLADYLGVSFQLKEMDYYGDIVHRENWIHADLKIPETSENEAEIVELTPGLIAYFSEQVKQVLVSLMSYVKLLKITDIETRRRNFAQLIENHDNLTREIIDDSVSDLVMEIRNEIVIKVMETMLDDGEDFYVFYGMLHLRAIEEFLLEKGYKPTGSKLVKVFSF